MFSFEVDLNQLNQWFRTISLVIFCALFVVGSPYGSQTSYQGRWTVNGRLAWITMELVSPIALTYNCLPALSSARQVSFWLWCLWLIHYINRSLMYPLRQPSRKPMHVGIMLSACLFNTINGTLNGSWLTASRYQSAVSQYIYDYPAGSIGGLSLFVVGMVGNIYHDNILMRLRATASSSSAYSIPKDGLFALVSCPHFLCEIVEWIGFALLCQSPAAWTFVINVVCNLLPRAYFIHQWYHRTFPQEYAKLHRRALVPYIF